jgi:hypothetical protein
MIVNGLGNVIKNRKMAMEWDCVVKIKLGRNCEVMCDICSDKRDSHCCSENYGCGIFM